ncbi:MAG: sigma-70 family RNA polymerase sigma factor [Gammaproteobacteria bacterium]|nr:sigma-70 family RNA polymerase sigma factor [Gammaproteobacteria bacterium]
MAITEDLPQLLARCALKDRKAFEQLYRSTSAQLFGLVLRIVRDQEIASEVLQESYVKIWNRAGDFRSDLAKPMTWMGAIARNQAIDSIRRSTVQPSALETVEELEWLADESEGPSEIVGRTQEEQALYECLNRLEGLQRQAMMLAYFNGLTHDELAQRLSTPLGTVKSWIRRGLLRLKSCLDER